MKSEWQRYIEKYPWYVSFYKARQRCTNPKQKGYNKYGGRGIKFLMTKDDFKELWFRDRAFEMKKPSIDRIDTDGNYKINNCQFLELKINSGKSGYKKRKPIIQYDLQGNFIKEWSSTVEACNVLKISRNHIPDVLHNRRKHSFGFIWKFKEEANA